MDYDRGSAEFVAHSSSLGISPRAVDKKKGRSYTMMKCFGIFPINLIFVVECFEALSKRNHKYLSRLSVFLSGWYGRASFLSTACLDILIASEESSKDPMRVTKFHNACNARAKYLKTFAWWIENRKANEILGHNF